MQTHTKNVSGILTAISSLNKNEAISKSNLAKKSNVHLMTINRFLDEYEVIQSFPELEIITTPNGDLLRFKINRQDIEYLLLEIKKELTQIKDKQNEMWWEIENRLEKRKENNDNKMLKR